MRRRVQVLERRTPSQSGANHRSSQQRHRASRSVVVRPSTGRSVSLKAMVLLAVRPVRMSPSARRAPQLTAVPQLEARSLSAEAKRPAETGRSRLAIPIRRPAQVPLPSARTIPQTARAQLHLAIPILRRVKARLRLATHRKPIMRVRLQSATRPTLRRLRPKASRLVRVRRSRLLAVSRSVRDRRLHAARLRPLPIH